MRALTLIFFAACSGGAPAPDAPAPGVAPAPEVAPEPAAPATVEAAPVPAAPAVQGEVPVGDPAAGEAVYAANCTACHQKDGTGMGGMLAADFTKEKERLAKSDAELLKSIREGITSKRGAMPAWGATLSEQQMADALAYVRKTFGGG